MLLPWPCNMWQLLARRSRKKRGGHRLPLWVVPVPIIFLAEGPSTRRSGDPLGQHIPGFIMREREGDQQCLLAAATLSLSLSLSALRTNGKKSERRGAGFSAVTSSALPGEAKLRAPRVRRCHCRRRAPQLPGPNLGRQRGDREKEEEGGGVRLTNGEDFPSVVCLLHGVTAR